MRTFILENTETGEIKEVEGATVSYQKPWRVKGFKGSASTAVAVAATKLGVPMPQILDAVRWLIQKDCPFCAEGTKVLRHLNEIGEDRAKDIIDQIRAAKEAKDLTRLEEIKKSLWPSDQQT